MYIGNNVVATYVNINVIDKPLYISCESEKRTRLLRKMTDDKREHAFCIFRSVVESASKTIQINKN